MPDNFTVVDFVANHDSNGLNAILFRSKRDGSYFLASDGLDLTLEKELINDFDTVTWYPKHFRDQEVTDQRNTDHQLTDLLRLAEKVPEDAKLILTGQSLGGTNVTALALLLGDRVHTTIAYNAPNPAGWASLPDGNFVRLSQSLPPSLGRYDLEASALGLVPLTAELVVSTVDTLTCPRVFGPRIN